MTPVGFSPDVEPQRQVVLWNNKDGKLGARDDKLFGRHNCFGGAVGDFDNDTDLDVYLVCGNYLDNAKNMLFENFGDRKFKRVKKSGGARGTHIGIGDSVAVADYDVDGFLDLFVRNGRGLAPFGVGPDELFHNTGNGNHWLEIDLEGETSNRNGIGSRITLSTGKKQQVRFVDNGTHGYVQDFRRLHFGLGKKQIVDEVKVEWPSGKVVTYNDIKADQVVVLKEDGGVEPRITN